MQKALLRLVAGAIVVSIVLGLLWQTGALSSTNDASTGAIGSPEDAQVFPPNLDLTTPPMGARSVGLRSGDLAPDFEFSNFDGKRVKLSSYRGRAVLLNFWATWCVPCRLELPDMSRILNEHSADLAVVGVNNGESLEAATSYTREIKVDLTAFAYDPRGAIAQRYALIGMPTSYLIDADGVITRVVNGQMSLNATRVAVDEAIAGYDSIKP